MRKKASTWFCFSPWQGFMFCMILALAFCPILSFAAEAVAASVNPGGDVVKKLLEAGSVLNVNTAAGTVGLFVWLEGMFMGWAPVWLRPLLPSIFSLLYWAITGYSEGMPLAKIATGAFTTSAGSMLIHDAKDWVMGQLPTLVGNLLSAGKPGAITEADYRAMVQKGNAKANLYNPDGSVKAPMVIDVAPAPAGAAGWPK